ncbi:MAG TPA: calcium-translocating P-type ATPase, PMCA-type [Fimbriiglobus sp.]|nr:calcium-translocating P-type ATPase, PMCA-type [Fimbriiglobus sp.]
MRTLRSVFDLFPDARTRGLSRDELAASRDRFGANRLTPLPREPVWKKFLEKFDEPIIKILLAATLLKITVDVFEASPLAGAVGLTVVVVGVAVAYLLRLGGWVPSVLFAFAGGLFALSVALGHPSVEGLAVMIAVALATGVSFASEYRSDREFEKLNAAKDAVRVKLVRGGDVLTAPLEEVAVGDLVLLETGDEVPADGRLTKGAVLRLDQSLMTGESEPAAKSARPDDDESDGPDQPGCLYRGTQVVDGLGEMIVTNVGDDTMLGQIARRLSGESPDEADEPEAGSAAGRVQQKLTLTKELTPLQQKLAVLAGLISKVGYAAAAAIFVALLVRGMFFTNPREVYWPDDPSEVLAVARNLLGYFVYMVIIVVVAVPEGLPMSVTVSLALAMRKMTRANSLVRQLVACETIGSATVICSDKTGTLTQNRMRVERVGVGGAVRDRAAGATTPVTLDRVRSPDRGAVEWVGLNAAVNSTATLEAKGGKTVVVGNTTEGALLAWLKDAGADYTQFRLEFPSSYRLAFSSEHKKMTTVARVGDRLVCLVKGAPEVVLALCTRTIDDAGKVSELSDAAREAIRDQLAAASGDAMRTLAFAHAELPADFPDDEQTIADRSHELEVGMVFAGFVAIRDPLRPDVREAVDRCREAGIEVKMITGDNAETARAIARDAGLLDAPGALALTSDEFAKLSDDELRDRLPGLRLLARAKPLDKYRMVKLLQSQAQVVAVTGDGTNDAPALKKADVGLAMGIVGTEVAKEASKIILLDDAFSTIVKAVHWGRALYENIQRFIQFQLTINVSALAIALLGPFLGFKPPFTVLQLLWINVIMDTFAAIALCSEPPRPGLMRAPPKRRDESILTPAMVGNILLTAGFFVVVMLALLWAMAGTPENPGLFGATGEDVAWLVRSGVEEEIVPASALERAADGAWRQKLPGGDARPVQVEFTAYQATVFFTVYVFFQVWNQINCRSLTPEVSGLRGLWRNPYFLLIASLTVVGQVVIVTFGGAVFDVEPLGLRDWLLIAAATMSVLVFAEVSRLIRKAV